MSAADVLLADRKYVSSVSRSLTISGGGGSTGDGEGRASGAEKDRTFRFFAPAGGAGRAVIDAVGAHGEGVVAGGQRVGAGEVAAAQRWLL